MNRVRLGDLPAGTKYRLCNVWFVVEHTDPITMSDGTVGVQVRYVHADQVEVPPRWLGGDLGIAVADDIVEVV